MRKLIASTVILSILCVTNASAGPNDKLIKLLLPNMVKAAEIKYELPEGLLAALIQTESSFNYKAYVKNDGSSNLPSHGLTQIQLDAAHLVQKLKAKESDERLTKRELVTARQLMNPETNIDYGAAYLKWLLDEYNGDYSKALTCYNAGPHSKICKSGSYSTYAGKILNAYLKHQASE
jgi:soluble lytic murein transglycosylase-like protein